MGRIAAVVASAVLLALAAWNVAALQPPEPVSSDEPVQQFSAQRAFAHVERIATQARPTGSPAQARARQYLVGVLAELGLDVSVQDAVGMRVDGPTEVAATGARNVVALLPGTDPTGRLFLVAHYDSVENGPGAGDDASGVAAILETVRALVAGPPLRNDVVVVLTDAEEAGLLGAEAFVSQHPLAADGGVVLNLEARGSGGPPIMFETSPGNAELAELYDAAAPHPVASSVAVEVYRALPRDTDFSVFLNATGFTGLNSAFIDSSASYHAPQDTAGRLSLGSLQAMGANTLAAARALGQADLDVLSQPASSDATYFPVLGELVSYPGWLVWPLAALATVAVTALALVARARGESSLPRVAVGFGLTLLPLVLAPLAAQALWELLVLLRPGYDGMSDPWQPGWYRLAVVALVVAVTLAWYALLRRKVGAVSLAVGGLGWLAVLGIVLAAAAPGGAYLVVLPALAGAVAGIIGVLIRTAPVRLGAALLGAAVAVVVLAPTVALFFPALGLATSAAPGLLVVLLLLAALPVIELLFPGAGAKRPRSGSVAVPATAMVAAVVFTTTGLAVATFDSRHPIPTQLMYALDADSGQAWWVSSRQPGPWTAQYLDGKQRIAYEFPVFEHVVATGPAQAASMPAPKVSTIADEVVGDTRRLTVRVSPQRQVQRVTVRVSAAAAISSANVAGRAVPAGALGTDRLTVTFHAPPEDGVEVSFTVAAAQAPVRLRLLSTSYGLTGLPGFVPRPDGVSVAGSHTSERVVVATRTILR